MNQKEIKKSIRKSYLRANFVLFVFLLIMVGLDWYLTKQLLIKRAELGLQIPISSSDTGRYITLPFLMLGLCVYIIEKVLLDIHKDKNN